MVCEYLIRAYFCWKKLKRKEPIELKGKRKGKNKMLLKIDVNREDILMNKKGRIVIKLNYYSEFSIGAHLATVKGRTLEDFENNNMSYGKSLFVGQNGGISVK